MHVQQLSGAMGAIPCNGSTTFVISPDGSFAAPCTAEFLGRFQGLQRAINDYVIHHGVSDSISVDGDLGQETLAAARVVWEHGSERRFAGWPANPPKNVGELATNAKVFGDVFAAAAGASSNTTPVVADSPQKLIIGDVTVLPKDDGGDGRIGLPLLLAGVAGVGTYLILGRKGKGKKSKSRKKRG